LALSIQKVVSLMKMLQLLTMSKLTNSAALV
jgi:hypothetical protein